MSPHPMPPRFTKVIILLMFLFLLPRCAEKTSDEYVKEGITQTENQHYDEAQEAFLNAIRKNPKNAEAHYSLGGIYNYLNEYEKAAESFRTAIKLDPVHFNAHYSLGFTYEHLNRKEDAEEEFQKYRILKEQFEVLLKMEQEKH